MFELFKSVYRRYFSDPQAILLAVFLFLGFAVVILFGEMLAPFFAAVVFAYLLEQPTQLLERVHIPRLLAVITVFLLFMAALSFLLLGLLPLLSQQITDFVQQLPKLINDGRQLLLDFLQPHLKFIPAEQINELVGTIRRALTDLGQNVLSWSLASISVVATVGVYLIIVPFLVFFFLKDKGLIIKWLMHFLPADRVLLTRIWREMDDQIGNYIRGKFNEILIVGVATYISFSFMGLEYAPLLSVVNGFSVIMPYIGTTLVTLPVVFAAYAQWGWNPDVLWITGIYLLIHFIDGNFVVPLLFSRAVNLHPVAIIVAILVFGGFWGFWGVFFAIPLATLVKAILDVWPTSNAMAEPAEIFEKKLKRGG
jgi:putative permease